MSVQQSLETVLKSLEHFKVKNINDESMKAELLKTAGLKEEDSLLEEQDYSIRTICGFFYNSWEVLKSKSGFRNDDNIHQLFVDTIQSCLLLFVPPHNEFKRMLTFGFIYSSYRELWLLIRIQPEVQQLPNYSFVSNLLSKEIKLFTGTDLPSLPQQTQLQPMNKLE